MSEIGFQLFDTDIGVCGIAWSGRGLVGVQLPEGDAEKARMRLQRRFPTAIEAEPPAAVGQAISEIQALLAGEPRDLLDVELDLAAGDTFQLRVYDIARRIPPGSTLTYGEVAVAAGEPGAAQAVGQIMGKNPFPIIIPCHRVVAAGGKLGGFSARGGVNTKIRLLEIEGALRPDALPLFAGR